MENLKFLLERYQKGIATTAEKRTLLDKLDMDENTLREWLQTEFDKTLGDNERLLSDNKSKKIFKKILDNTSQEPEKKIHILRKRKVYKWVAAACAGILFLWGLNTVYTSKKTGKNHIVSIKTDKSKPIWLKRISNDGNAIMTTVLEDGTKVSLSPKSSIAYNSSSDTVTRAVLLEGLAEFHVMHDEKHPFTVRANGIIITDLGTVFSVNSFCHKVQVKLFKGKVMIHSSCKELAMKDTYLKPGEQFDLSVQGKLTISDFRENTDNKVVKDKIIKAVPVQPFLPEHRDSFIFNQTSLAEVFDKMSNMYNRQINYNIKQVKTMSFSGTINRSDSMRTILKVICSTNDLNCKDSAGSIFIYK